MVVRYNCDLKLLYLNIRQYVVNKNIWIKMKTIYDTNMIMIYKITREKKLKKIITLLCR